MLNWFKNNISNWFKKNTTLYQLTEFCNGKESLSYIYFTKELAEARKERPTRSSSLRVVDGEYHMVPDIYEYKIEEFEWYKPLRFDVYVICPKTYYSLRGQRISGLTYEKAQELYNEYSKREYVELQLTQKQFGSYGITKIESNVDEHYWKLHKAWEEEQSEDPNNYPENEPSWMR